MTSKEPPRARLVSQRTSEPVLGIPSRDFLERIRSKDCPLRVTRLGKLRLVDADEAVAWLRTLDVGADESDVDEADRVLASMGLRVVAGGRR